MSNREDIIKKYGAGEYLGEHYGYQLFRNSEGFIEGYQSVLKPRSKKKKYEIVRIVTNTTIIEEFPKFIIRTEKPIAKYDPYKDEKQLKIE